MSVEEAQQVVAVRDMPRTMGARKYRSSPRRLVVVTCQLALIAAVIAAWQWFPSIGFLANHVDFLNPAIISSPGRVGQEFRDLLFGTNDTATIWPYLGTTLRATALALVFGILAGMSFGLLLSSARLADSVIQPFIYSLNAIPIIAVIPVLDIVFGPNTTLTAVTGGIIVFFLTFFNAREGAQAITKETVQNAQLLGAGRFDIMVRIRLPYVIGWTFTALPNAISFGLLGVVTAEFLAGVPGIGYVLTLALSDADPTKTIAVAIILAAISLVLVGASRIAKNRLLHWWGA